MGVSGSGKSTVGKLLADRLGVEFGDADDFHNPANIAKMAAGTPLTDTDRWPWLEAIGRWLDQHRATGAVATCSALKLRYRDALREHAPHVWFLHVRGSQRLITSRIAHRAHHFMPASLVASQFEALEPLRDDERAITEDIAQPPDAIVDDFLHRISLEPE